MQIMKGIQNALVKIVIGGTLVLLTVLQFLSIPGQFRYMAEQDPESAFLRWPLTLLGMTAILALQIVLVSLWHLIDEIRGANPFSKRSRIFIARIRYSLTVFLVILGSGLIFVLSQADDPGFPFLLIIITGFVTLLLLVISEIGKLFDRNSTD
jgi:hypothetical protein